MLLNAVLLLLVNRSWGCLFGDAVVWAVPSFGTGEQPNAAAGLGSL